MQEQNLAFLEIFPYNEGVVRNCKPNQRVIINKRKD